MLRSDLDALQTYLSESLGLAFLATSRPSSEGEIVDIIPVGVHPAEGFKTQVVLGWRSVRADFVLGRFARDLVQAMALANAESRSAFRAVADSLAARRWKIDLNINGSPASPTDTSAWPSDWHSLAVAVLGRPFDPSATTTATMAEVRAVAEALIALVLCLAAESSPVEDDSASPTVLGYPEGAMSSVQVVRYERDRRNRSLCIAAHGTLCFVCGFDFERAYGALGCGFIHVHHILPVSMMGPDYMVNPVTDLVPLCPNCHAMIHRRHPPLVPAELSTILKAHRG